MADSNIAGLPAGAAIADTDLIAGSDAGSGTLVKKTGLQFNTYIRQMLAALPTSDPHVVGALWNNGGLVAISFPFVRSLAGNTGTYALTGHTAALVAGAPTFQVDFTSISTLPAQVTFSRASNATLFDSTGTLTYAPNNLLLQSNTFTDAAWTKDQTGSISATGISDPIGGTAASTFITGASSGRLYQNVFPLFISTKNGISSVWLRRRTGSGPVSMFNASAASIPITITGTWTQYTLDVAGGPDGFAGIQLDTNGDAVDIYAPTLSAVTYETTPRTVDQVITTSSPYYGPRFDYAWNGSSWVGAGLLIEETRTNLLQQSNDLGAGWSPEFVFFSSGGTSPDGTAAQLVTEGTGSSRYDFLKSVALGSDIYTVSFYVKSNGRRYVTASMGATTTRIAFDLNSSTITQNDANASGTITSIGGSWYRCTMTSVSAVAIDYIVVGLSDTGTPAWDSYGRTVYVGDGTSGVYFYGLQLEAAAFATSYIPTTSASVTRSADVALLTGTATTALEGSAASAILEAQLFATTPAGTEVLFGKSPTAYSFVRTATTLSFFSGGADLTATFGSGNISSAFRTAISFDGGTRNIVINGGTLVSGATVAAVTGDVPLGGYASGAQIATGWYRKMAIWNNRLLDATLTSKSVVGTPF